MPSWSEFERKQVEQPGKTAAEEFSDVCARLLITHDGKEFIRHLYAQYVDNRLPTQAPEAALREAEAKRRLVFDLEKARDEGLERAAAKPKT